MSVNEIIIKAVNISYTFFYFVIISRMIISFIPIRPGGFYNFIMRSSELVIAPFRRFNLRTAMLDFSPFIALLALMFGRDLVLAVLIYLPVNNFTGFTAAVMIACLDMIDLFFGLLLALVCIYGFVKLKIRSLLQGSQFLPGGFSPDRLLFMFGRWCNPLLIPLTRMLPDGLKKYAEIVLILLIILIKLLLKYLMASLKYYLY